MKFLFAAALLLLSVFGSKTTDGIDFLDMMKKELESIDAKKFYADMVEANTKYLEEMEEEKKEVLEDARKVLKDNKEKLEAEENDINEVYNQWIKESSVIESEDKIVKSIEVAKQMIDAFKIEKPEERDIAIKNLMMSQVDPKKDINEAEKQIDAIIEMNNKVSKQIESMVKKIEEYKPTKEEKEAKKEAAKYLDSLWEKLLNQDVTEVEEDKKEESKDGEGLINKDGVKDRLINNNLADMIDGSTIDTLG